MKRLAICLLALLLVFPCMSALAGDYLGAMCVVNCKEWVSLRLLPDVQSDVVARVPYEAVVLAYYENEEFTRCYYDSRWGYIQNQYLEMEEPYISDGRSSAEQELQSSDFFQRYPDYEAFNDNYANTVHTAGWSVWDFLSTSGGARDYVVVNCESFVSLRMEADEQTPRLMEVPLGTVVPVDGFWHGWALCSYNTRCGWIKAQYLEPYNSAASDMGSHSDAYWSEMYIANCEEWVSLRQYPDTGSARLAKIPLGACVKVTELTGAFAGVYYDGMFGYVLRDYLASSPPYMGEDDLREDPGYYLDEMYVTNCEEWISLYDDTDTTSARLARIPLGTRLSAYQVDTRFAIVDYNDIIGFVLLEYLSMDPPSTTIWQESTIDPQYGPWSDWGDESVQSSASRQVETRTVYGYYYYSCPSCGNHVHVYDCGDPEWCGGCGYSGSLESGWNYVFTETYYDYDDPAATLSDWHGTGRYFYDDPEYGRLFAWIHSGNPAPYGKIQYRYRDVL